MTEVDARQCGKNNLEPKKTPSHVRAQLVLRVAQHSGVPASTASGTLFDRAIC
jgi:hypothetical protein